ncbi:hypothetical protein BC936DRAFT_140539, partial [Jimgerdemannia flammicorona]
GKPLKRVLVGRNTTPTSDPSPSPLLPSLSLSPLLQTDAMDSVDTAFTSLLAPKDVPLTYLTAITQPLYPLTITCSTIVLITYFFLAIRHPIIQTDKQRSWLLTLFTSFFMSLGGLCVLYKFWYAGWEISAWTDEGPLWLGLTAFFQTFLVLDLAIGWVYYRKRIDPLSGWTHHIIYFFTLWWVISQRMSQLFILMCLLEAPTFALALGSINAKWRKDMVFAALYVPTRLVFHGFMLYILYNYHSNPASVYVLGMFYPMHVYWFYGFVKQQRRLARRRLSPPLPITPPTLPLPPTDAEFPTTPTSPTAYTAADLHQRSWSRSALAPLLSPDESPRKKLVDATARRVISRMPERFRSERIDRWIDRMAGVGGMPVTAY